MSGIRVNGMAGGSGPGKSGMKFSSLKGAPDSKAMLAKANASLKAAKTAGTYSTTAAKPTTGGDCCFTKLMQALSGR